MAVDPNRATHLQLSLVQNALYPGKIFYVNNSSVKPEGAGVASNSNSGTSPLEALSTIAGAVAKCVASRFDTIVVLPGHAETVTAAVTVNIAGVRIIGVGKGSLKPTITGNFAGDAMTITAANVRVENIHFAAPSTDEQTAFINVAAANVELIDISGIGSAASKNVVDCITIASGGDDLKIEGLRIWNTNTAVNSFISIEAAVARLQLRDVMCFGDVATAGIIDGATATQLFFDRVSIGVVGTTKAAATLDSNPTGLIQNSYFAGTSTTLANNAALGTGIRLMNVLVLEETDGSKQGAPIPAVDAD